MTNVLKDIYAWQVETGNASKPYDDWLECSFQVEEALEGFDLSILAEVTKCDSKKPKELSRHIVKLAMEQSKIYPQSELTDVQRADKHADGIVYHIGSLAKLGLDLHGIVKVLAAVNKANKQKLGMARDSAGKLLKPDDFVGPEPEIQKILDSIKK